jgi:hypothetical protein
MGSAYFFLSYVIYHTCHYLIGQSQNT